MKRIVRKAARLAAVAALLTCVIRFREILDYWSEGAGLGSWCFQDPREVVAWKASGWALLAFVGVFSVAMEILVRRKDADGQNGETTAPNNHRLPSWRCAGRNHGPIPHSASHRRLYNRRQEGPGSAPLLNRPQTAKDFPPDSGRPPIKLLFPAINRW
jgi:hypothetical protein